LSLEPTQRAPQGQRPGRRTLAAACVLAGLSFASVAAAASAAYSITALSLGDRPLYVKKFSSAGHATGVIRSSLQDSSIYFHGFVRSATGTVTEIPTLAGGGAADAGVSAAALGVNASGDVVGYSDLGVAQVTHAFLYKNGSTLDLSGFLGDYGSQASDINNNGTIVGLYQNFSSAFVLKPLGPTDYMLIDLGSGGAYAVSESGYVVGETRDANYHSVPFVFRDANDNGIVDDGEYTVLGTLGGLSSNIALDVNDAGKVVGQSLDADENPHAVIWNSITPGAVPQDLGSLGGNGAYALSINNANQIVGASSGYAFLYQANQMRRLDSLIPAEHGTTFPTWQLFAASAIGNSGEIAVEGIANNTSTFTGALLKPGGTVTPPPTEVKLSSFTANPGTITLGSKPVSATFTLGLTAKTKTAIKVPLVIKLNGETVLGFPVNVGKNKSSSSSTLKFDQDWAPGTYSVTASYGGVDKTATLVVNPVPPITLKSLTFPAKVKRGKKVNASLALTDTPSGTAEVKLVLLDATQTPIVFLGIPLEYVVTLDRKDSITAKVTIPTALPAGTYFIRASYGGVTKTVQFQAQ